ncbi:hypothetical protein EPHNCH_1216 [Anaplasma phagocytophilum str. NCH-1]|nr:hypothetical protein EPHNCH_1216 [Anaplasma phagocytophilum str. NCH-1]
MKTLVPESDLEEVVYGNNPAQTHTKAHLLKHARIHGVIMYASSASQALP